MIIIQFSNLGELLAELPPGHTVRVAHHQSISTNTVQGIPHKTATLFLHVRSLAKDGTVLCYNAFRKEVDSWANEYPTEVWKRTRAEFEKVCSALSAEITHRGYTVRPGLIDIGAAQPLLGEPYPVDEAQ